MVAMMVDKRGLEMVVMKVLLMAVRMADWKDSKKVYKSACKWV